eukprot:scaffold293487_cov30-Tisochrysis_lutea.AAC.2
MVAGFSSSTCLPAEREFTAREWARAETDLGTGNTRPRCVRASLACLEKELSELVVRRIDGSNVDHTDLFVSCQLLVAPVRAVDPECARKLGGTLLRVGQEASSHSAYLAAHSHDRGGEVVGDSPGSSDAPARSPAVRRFHDGETSRVDLLVDELQARWVTAIPIWLAIDVHKRFSPRCRAFAGRLRLQPREKTRIAPFTPLLSLKPAPPLHSYLFARCMRLSRERRGERRRENGRGRGGESSRGMRRRGRGGG